MNGLSSRIPVPCCRLSLISAQTIPATTWTAIAFDSVDYDPRGLYIPGVGIVVKESGLYAITLSVSWATIQGSTGYYTRIDEYRTYYAMANIYSPMIEYHTEVRYLPAGYIVSPSVYNGYASATTLTGASTNQTYCTVAKLDSSNPKKRGYFGLSSRSPVCHVLARDSSQSIPYGTWTRLIFDDVLYNTGEFDVSVGFTAKKSGLYMISIQAAISGNIGNTRYSANISANKLYGAYYQTYGYDLSVNDIEFVWLNAGDVIAPQVYIAAATSTNQSVYSAQSCTMCVSKVDEDIR